MSNEKWKEQIAKYESYSDIDLAREFVKADSEVNLLWEDVSDDISDLRELLIMIIAERYVKHYIGILWDDNDGKYGNWSVPDTEIGWYHQSLG